jgi:hypothetical protein
MGHISHDFSNNEARATFSLSKKERERNLVVVGEANSEQKKKTAAAAMNKLDLISERHEKR